MLFCRVISTIVQIKEIAQYILQETFTEIWKYFNQFDPVKGRLYTWMAKNLAVDYLRTVNYRNFFSNEDLSKLTQQIDQKFQILFILRRLG